MKTKVEVLKKFRKAAGRFELRENAVRQLFLNPMTYNNGKGIVDATWREASRNSLKRFFTKLAKAKDAAKVHGTSWGKYEHQDAYAPSWGVYMVGKSLRVGCVQFTPQQTQVIRKWALA